MATEAARLEDKELTGRKKKTDLTLAGLLMEGGMRPYLHPTGLGRLGQLGAMLRAYGDLPRRRRRGPALATNLRGKRNNLPCQEGKESTTHSVFSRSSLVTGLLPFARGTCVFR